MEAEEEALAEVQEAEVQEADLPAEEAMAEAEENFKTKKDLGCLKMASRL